MSAKQDALIEQQQNYLDFVLAEKPYRSVKAWDKSNARTELAQLRATIAEQARQLEEARIIIQFLKNSENGTLRNAARNWLAAHPAPDTEPQPPNGEGKP